MRVYGIHRNRLIKPPNFASLGTLNLQTFASCLEKVYECARHVEVFLEVLQALPLEVEDSVNFVAEKTRALKIFAAWNKNIHDAVLQAASERIQESGNTYRELTVSRNKLEAVVQRLWKMLAERAVDSDEERDPTPLMHVSPPWEALVSCILAMESTWTTGTFLAKLRQLFRMDQIAPLTHRGETDQPGMLHLSFAKTKEGDVIAVVGYTRCRYRPGKFGKGFRPLEQWFKTCRTACMKKHEFRHHKANRFRALNELKRHELSPDTNENKFRIRLDVITACQDKIKYIQQGSDREAIAISYPELVQRNRCTICQSTTQWKMFQEAKVESAVRAEVERDWNIFEGTEMQCAEVETEIELERLVTLDKLNQVMADEG